jgi:hypothetical protein
MQQKTWFFVIRSDLEVGTMCKSVIALMGSVFLVAGCAAFKTDLVGRKTVSVETIHSDEKSYLDVEVSQKDTIATVSGRLNLDLATRHGAVPGHMDVTLIAPSGEPVLVASAPYRRAHPSEPSSHASFAVSAHMLVAEGSKVTLRHHGASMKLHLPMSTAE